MRLFEKYSGVFLIRALIAWVRCRMAFKVKAEKSK
jgi:hypothetical protein